ENAGMCIGFPRRTIKLSSPARYEGCHIPETKRRAGSAAAPGSASWALPVSDNPLSLTPGTIMPAARCSVWVGLATWSVPPSGRTTAGGLVGSQQPHDGPHRQDSAEPGCHVEHDRSRRERVTVLNPSGRTPHFSYATGQPALQLADQ